MSSRLSQPIERIQYFTLNGDEYCWYGDAWKGAGWYQCGNQWNDGLGWGGAYGWNGWGGGGYVRTHGSHRVGVWHPGRPHVSGGVAGSAAPSIDLEPRQRRGRQDLPNSVSVPTLSSLDQAERGDPSPAVHSAPARPGHEGLANHVDVPVLPDLYDSSSVGHLSSGIQFGPERPDGHERLPGSVGDPALPGLPDSAALGLHGFDGAGVQGYGFHPDGGFQDHGIHFDSGLGGFAGFHASGGGMSFGGHVGGIGHR